MGKSEVGTPKWIAKQMKMKGLQKLKWYCQACEKQCRDDHGFKLHLQSPSHLAKAEASQAERGRMSLEFEKAFLKLLRSHHGKPVGANTIYSELIQDRQHVHMNATRFKSLTGFANYLDSKNLVTVIAREPELVVQAVDSEARHRKEQKEAAQDLKNKELEKLNQSLLEAAIQGEAQDVEREDDTEPLEPKLDNASQKARPKIGFSLKKKK